MTDTERLRLERDFLLDALQRAASLGAGMIANTDETPVQSVEHALREYQALKATLHQRQRDLAAHADWGLQHALHTAHKLVAVAERAGLVVTIEQTPLRPLAMGHYAHTVSVRRARSRA